MQTYCTLTLTLQNICKKNYSYQKYLNHTEFSRNFEILFLDHDGHDKNVLLKILLPYYWNYFVKSVKELPFFFLKTGGKYIWHETWK